MELVMVRRQTILAAMGLLAVMGEFSPALCAQACPPTNPAVVNAPTVPAEILSPAMSPQSLVSGLHFDIASPRVEDLAPVVDSSVEGVADRRITADLSVSVTLSSLGCAIRYTIGVILRHATFLASAPSKISLRASSGISNVAFDAAALADALKVLLPLPEKFSLSVRLEEVPSTVDGMSFAVGIDGPGQLGRVAEGKWRLDRNQPDLGLRGLIDDFIGHHTDLPAARDVALAEVTRQLHARIDDYLKGKSIDLGMMVASKLTIDWARWDRGDTAFTVEIGWPGADEDVVAILPASARLRFEHSAPRLVLAPIDPEALRRYLAKRIVEVAPDTADLDEVMRQFGQKELKTVPLGWLRIRNVVLTAEGLTAELAFAIGDKDVRWVRVEAPLPLKTSAFEKAIAELAKTAVEAAKEIATQTAEQKAYKLVNDFLAQHSKQTLFGLEWEIVLKQPAVNKLPSHPLVTLSANQGQIVIDDVVLIMVNNAPVFDFGAAHVNGFDALAKMIAAEADLAAGDLSLNISGLSLSGGRLTGEISGDFLGTSFVAPISIGQHEVDLRLPDARSAIVVSLQQALDGQEVNFLGLKLHDILLCPEGVGNGICGNGALAAKASFAVSDLFSGSLVLMIHPTVQITRVDVDPSSGILSSLDLLTDGVATINVPTQYSPLVISGTIRLSNLFDVVPLPDVPFEWSSATGKVHLGIPTTIAIDTDIFIPPWLALSQIRVPIGKGADGTVTMGMRLTVGEHYVQYILNVDGTLAASPKAKTVKIVGKLAILTLPLYQIDGTLDFDKKEMTTTSKTTGVLKAVIPQESVLKVFGEHCLASEEDNVRFLFFKAQGSLVVQLPPGFCGTALPKMAAECGLTSAGGLCLAAKISAGQLGSGKGTLLAGFDLDFTATVETHIKILIASVDLALRANERRLSVKARIDAGVAKVKLGLTIAAPRDGSDDSVHKILQQIVEKLLKNPHLDLSKPISVDSGSGNVDVSVEADDGGEPKMSSMSPADGKQVEQGAGQTRANPEVQPATSPAKHGAAPQAGEQTPPPAGSNLSAKQHGAGSSQTTAIFPGTIIVSYDADNRVRETDTQTNNSEVSKEPLDAVAIAAVRGACAVRWFSNGGGNFIPTGPAHADAVLLSTTSTIPCPVPPNCQPEQFCAYGLRNGGAGSGTVPIAGKFDWPSATGLGNQPQRASDLELGLITALAGTQVFSPHAGLGVDPAATWACVVAATDKANCRLALERAPDGNFPAFVSQDGSIVEIDAGSLTLWAAAQAPQLRNEIFAAQLDESLFIFGSGDKAWLVGIAGSGRVELLTIRRADASKGPVVGTASSSFGTTLIWTNRHGKDLVLDATADLLADFSAQKPALTDLGEVMGAHRVLVNLGDQVWLLSPGAKKPCIRQKAAADLANNADLAKIDGTGTLQKLARALNMPTAEWRKVGFPSNPAIAFFGTSCSN